MSRRSTSRAPTGWHHRSQSRGQPYRSPSSCRNSSNSRSPSQDHHNRTSPRCSRCSPTPFRYKVSHLTSSPNLSQVDESQLYTDRAPDGYRSFHTTLQLITKQGCKTLIQGQKQISFHLADEGLYCLIISMPTVLSRLTP